MGCWNHTCAVTNLPIIVGEEVEVILLREPSFLSDFSSYCYPNTSWTPIPLTFSGTYDDYGSVENCEGPALDIIIDVMRENLHEMELGENKYHDIEAKKESFDVEYMFKLDHEGRFLIKNPIRNLNGPENCHVKHIVVRKDVYDGIVTKTKFGRWWDSPKGITLAKIDRDEFTKDLDKFLDPNELPPLENMDGDLDELNVKQRQALQKSLKRYQLYDGIGTTATTELINYKGQGPLGIDKPIHIIETLVTLREEKSDLYEGVLDNALRFAYFNLFMNNARKTYTVPSGAGSQDDTTVSQELCARLTLSSAKAQRKWWKDKYEE